MSERKQKGGDLFVCPISNGQSERASKGGSASHLLCMHPIPCIWVHARAGLLPSLPLAAILFALGYTLAKPLGRISKGAAAGGLEEAIVKPMSKGSAQFSPCEPTFCIC